MVKITVRYSDNIKTVFVKTKHNTEVMAFNYATNDYEWWHIVDCVKDRSGLGYIVKNELSYS